MSNRVIFDIGHPKQVHQFKYTFQALERAGWDCLFVAKNKDITLKLLHQYGFQYEVLGHNRKGILNKILDLPRFEYDFYKIVKRYNPDIVISRFSAHSAHVAKLLNIPHIGFTDTEHATLLDSITVPFVDVKLTATSYLKPLGKNHMRYNGNIELAYLHPNHFQPDPAVKKILKLKPGEKYAILRFVSWDAYHDFGETGFNLAAKQKIVHELAQYAKIYISAEGELPATLEKYRINIPLEKMHSALYYAALYIGESPTMTSEAGILGTPAICVSSWAGKCGNFQDLKNYGLIKCYTPEYYEMALSSALNILQNKKAKDEWQQRKRRFLRDKIDVSDYMVWFIYNFPQSMKIQKRRSV